MAYPTLHDDGTTVTLDLHGVSVDEALRLAHAVVRAAAARGRSTVKLIHGTSTSDVRYRNRTIKHALHDAIDQGRLAPDVTGDWRAEGFVVVSLNVTPGRDPAPLRLRDVMR